MTERQRGALLALPETEDEVVRHHSFDAGDLAAIAGARTPETRLGYALQLACLRYPGRHLRRGERLPAIMLDHVAEQVGVDAAAIASFARRTQTRYEQLAAIKRQFGFTDLTRPARRELATWLADEAIGLTDGKLLIERLLNRMREQRIIVPGVTVVERMAGEAMHAADTRVTSDVHAALREEQRAALDALLSDKAHAQQSRLSWLREPPSRVGGRSLLELLDKIDLLRATGYADVDVPGDFSARFALMAREGARHTAQSLQQMGPARRYTTLVATLRELEATLTDAAIAMFGALVGRANLNARKRLEETIAVADEQGRERLTRIAGVLEALTSAARTGGDIAAAVAAVADLDVIAADAALIRRTVRPGRPRALGELAAEYRVFKQVGDRFLCSFAFEGRAATAALRTAIGVLVDLAGDWRKPLPADVPLGHVELRWHRHVVSGGRIDRTYWELATYFAVSSALTSGDLWVPTSRVHRALEDLITPATAQPGIPVALLPPPTFSADEWLARKSVELDAALLATARGLSGKDPLLFTGEKLRFPKGPKADDGDDAPGRALGAQMYGALPTIRITDVLSQVARWTGFVDHFGHVSSGLPPSDERAFLAALIAEATNLGLTRMADICGVASRRALLRMQTWHMREDTFRAALGCLTDAIHAEPVAAWFGEGWRATADGQHFYLGGPGEGGGSVNAHYGRDPIVKIYTTITDRYAPLHQTVIAGTAGEAIHALDGILGHESGANIGALHTDGGGVSDIVFAVMHLLGLNFEPRIPRLSDRRLYAFEPRARYGRLAPLFGHRLDANLIRGHWQDVAPLIEAMRNRTVTPSLILKKLSAFRQQNTLAAALREIGRVERTLFTLRWFEDPALRRQVTAELNKGEARNTLARAVAFHRLGRFRDRGHENQQTRAAALNLVTAAIILFNCRYLDRAMSTLNIEIADHKGALGQLSPLGWDHINLTGDYVWSDPAVFDADGFLPLKVGQR
ncbi:Tn3 family transposase [Erythrobacteraceae bacterium CFH 75059]|uniref:Tn3 family transposase n=1 Tax=Qipengyuania thermophila TaxID=2509361 RepID=UPI00102080F9|nr:Tn3 family transposase [Erythrobacteraceae bacterium CFH 75059]